MSHPSVEPAEPAVAPPSVEGLVIRAARSSDCEGITELANMPGYRAGTLRLPFQSLEHTRKWIESDDPNAVNIVAVVDERIVGQAGLQRFSGRRSHAGGIGMGVHDEWRGRGIGAALLTALTDTADNWLGLKRLELTVFNDNTPAIRLYEKFGFEREGICRSYAFRAGAYADVISMARLRGVDPLAA